MNYQLNIFLIYLTSTVLFTTLCGTKATVAQPAGTLPSAGTTGQFNSIIEDLVEIEQLRIPTSPVLNLLDESGRVINRPTTPKSFGLSLVESFSNSNGDFPQGLALELAPYWWFQQPDISFDDYYNANVGQTILQTLSFSLASTNQTLEETDSTGAGFGLRFNILAGEANPALETEINKLEAFVEKCTGKTGDIILPAKVNQECLKEMKSIKSINTTAKKIQDLDGSRVGWQLELASATTFNILDDDLDDADLARVGAWLTSSYRPTNSESFLNQFSFLGIARYIYEDISDDSQSIVDLGTGIVWQNENMPISVSLEYLHRFAEDDDDRLVGIAEYRISNQYSAFISYGKDFEDFSGNDDLVTLVGLKFGLGKGPVVNTD